ncbi:CD1375 family protein [Caloramator sp. E03]|nr:CD1375 family protein [Caloramator sp. E03]
MVELYVALIKAGKRTIEQVPEKFRAGVQALLDSESNG